MKSSGTKDGFFPRAYRHKNRELHNRKCCGDGPKDACTYDCNNGGWFDAAVTSSCVSAGASIAVDETGGQLAQTKAPHRRSLLVFSVQNSRQDDLSVACRPWLMSCLLLRAVRLATNKMLEYQIAQSATPLPRYYFPACRRSVSVGRQVLKAIPRSLPETEHAR